MTTTNVLPLRPLRSTFRGPALRESTTVPDADRGDRQACHLADKRCSKDDDGIHSCHTTTAQLLTVRGACTPHRPNQEDQHSFAGWLADMLSWGRYTEIGQDGE